MECMAMKNNQFAKTSLLVVAGLVTLLSGSLAAQTIQVTPSTTFNFAAPHNATTTQSASFQVSTPSGASASWFSSNLACQTGSPFNCPVTGAPWVTVNPTQGGTTPTSVGL